MYFQLYLGRFGLKKLLFKVELLSPVPEPVGKAPSEYEAGSPFSGGGQGKKLNEMELLYISLSLFGHCCPQIVLEFV
ncbi:hypothetical protein [Sneathiella chinensis]|uniref:hypothetical protein n=1 Tax=Sneathiella chinensis TaxID=349750 RepID=UPI00146C328E|nr:hypothetical protein [Sneathiella chinensis]